MAISLLLCVSPQRNSLSMARVDEVIDGVPSIGWCPVPRKTARSLSWWLSDKKENGDCWRIERRIDQVASSRINLSLCHRESSGSQGGEASSGFDGDTPAEPKGRKKWTASDDVVLISAWLNTSKDPVVNNEQRAGTFWNRVADYFAASQEAAATQREPNNCKHRWHRINDEVSKFCGAYEAATREKTSGQNENDVLKNAHRIFLTNQNKKFTLEHAWKDLRNDQKWCDLGTAKTDGSSKKRKCDKVADSSPSEATANKRPPGIKAAKANGKKKVGQAQSLDEFESMWTIKHEDLKLKQGNHKMSLLDKLMGKKEPLTESEKGLKQKLIDDLMSS